MRAVLTRVGSRLTSTSSTSSPPASSSFPASWLGCWTHPAAWHLLDGLILVELELPDEREGDEALVAARALQRAISRFRASAGDVEALAQVAVAGIRAISGYERVLVYRFDERWDGKAIAEDRVEDWDQSFLGLHFPASDIPLQARDLYVW